MYVLYDTYVCINTSVHTKVDYVITVNNVTTTLPMYYTCISIHTYNSLRNKRNKL